jgi:hypothetical protein
MHRCDVEEFYRELQATDENYVRRKLASGGYDVWQLPHVLTWLGHRDAEREADRAKAESLRASSLVLWTKVAAAGTVGSFAIAVATFVALWTTKN